MGSSQLQGIWKWPEYTSASPSQQPGGDNKGRHPAGLAFPLGERFSRLHPVLQRLRRGLIDYDSTSRIGVGVSLTDPFCTAGGPRLTETE